MYKPFSHVHLYTVYFSNVLTNLLPVPSSTEHPYRTPDHSPLFPILALSPPQTTSHYFSPGYRDHHVRLRVFPTLHSCHHPLMGNNGIAFVHCFQFSGLCLYPLTVSYEFHATCS